MRNLVYEGKSKRVYEIDSKTLIMEFKDEVTAFDGAKRDLARGKGELCAAITAFLFKKLEENGIDTHLIEYDGSRRLKVKKLKIFPVEVIIRNYAYGSLLKRMPLYRLMQKLQEPIIEFHYKDDKLHDPLILESDILNTNIMSNDQLNTIKSQALRINDVLTKIFGSKNLVLIDLKLEFGVDIDSGSIVLGDEISGDSFRVVDSNHRHYDKDVYRKSGDPEKLVMVYRELNKILGV